MMDDRHTVVCFWNRKPQRVSRSNPKQAPKLRLSEYITAPVCEGELMSLFVTAEVCPTEVLTEYEDAECRCKPEKVQLVRPSADA
jgi:hypothetical protein